MKACRELRVHLLGDLGEAERAEFEAHAARCERCTAEIRTFSRNGALAREWRAQAASTASIEERAASLMRAVSNREGVSPRWRPARRFALFAVPAATAIAIVAYLVGTVPPAPPATESATVVRDRTVPAEIVLNQSGSIGEDRNSGSQLLSVPGEGRLLAAIGGDRVAVGAKSEVAILESTRASVSLRLVRGRIVVAARKRSKGETLVVRAKEWTVTVVGTRFEVASENGGVSVAVDEGIVAVQRAGFYQHLVSAGVRLSLGSDGSAREVALSEAERAAIAAALDEAPAALPGSSPHSRGTAIDPEKATPSSPPFERPKRESADAVAKAPELYTIRAWILAGETDRARAALEERVSQRSGDAAAWMLLATCRQKAGDETGAIRAYDQVIASGTPADANRARFLEAKLYQDGLGAATDAERLFADYLAHAPKPLEAEAMVRLAQAQLALGKEAEARKTAADIAGRFPGSAQALAAQGLFYNVAP